jgi:predicted nucleotidyltransferase component of viral defense system
MGYKYVPFSVTNDWFSKNTSLKTYHLSELAGTKLRALYQRKKGRDLFDLYKILNFVDIQYQDIINSYYKYMAFEASSIPSKREYILNVESKLQDYDFTHDMQALLPPGIEYDIKRAYAKVTDLIELM